MMTKGSISAPNVQFEIKATRLLTSVDHVLTAGQAGRNLPGHPGTLHWNPFCVFRGGRGCSLLVASQGTGVARDARRVDTFAITCLTRPRASITIRRSPRRVCRLSAFDQLSISALHGVLDGSKAKRREKTGRDTKADSLTTSAAR